MTATPVSTSRTHRHGLRAVLAAVSVSSLGDGAFLAALPLAAAAVTTNPAEIGAVSVAGYLPWILVAPAAGALIDRWPYRSTLISADLVRAVALAALAFVVLAGHSGILSLSIAAFIAVAGQVFHDGATQSAVAALAGRDQAELDRANGRIFAADAAGRNLLGPPAGSVSFAVASWIPFGVNALSFAVSAGLLAVLPHGLRPSESNGSREPVWTAARRGIVFLLGHRQLRVLAVLTAAATFSYQVSWATFVLYATSGTGLGVSVAGFGVLVAALAAGAVVGGPLAGFLTKHLGAGGALVTALATAAVGWFGIAFAPNPWVAGAFLATIGVTNTVVTVVNASARQRLAPADMLGRVVTAFRTIANSAAPLGAAVSGFAAAGLGLRAPLIIAGCLLAVSFLGALPLVRR